MELQDLRAATTQSSRETEPTNILHTFLRIMVERHRKLSCWIIDWADLYQRLSHGEDIQWEKGRGGVKTEAKRERGGGEERRFDFRHLTSRKVYFAELVTIDSESSAWRLCRERLPRHVIQQ